MDEFKHLLDNQENNVLVDIHSCPIERSYIGNNPTYEDYFTTVPRGIYVVLIADFNKLKVGADNVQHVDRRMYGSPMWPWNGDKQIIRTAQIYFPGDRIFNPLMMFGEPGEYDEDYDIFDVTTGNPSSFNKNDPHLLGHEAWKTYTRQTILSKLRGYHPKIVYIATCDPRGNKPEDWSVREWNRLIDERLYLQNRHREFFRTFKMNYGKSRKSSRQRGYQPIGRSAMGLNDDIDQIHYDPDYDSVTPRTITAVSKFNNNLECISECDYKDSCINNIPGLGNLIKNCQNKYCDLADGTNGICIDYNDDVEGGIINLRTSAPPRTPRSRNRKKTLGGKRKLKKKKRKTRKLKKTRKHRRHKRKSRRLRKKR